MKNSAKELGGLATQKDLSPNKPDTSGEAKTPSAVKSPDFQPKSAEFGLRRIGTIYEVEDDSIKGSSQDVSVSQSLSSLSHLQSD